MCTGFVRTPVCCGVRPIGLAMRFLAILVFVIIRPIAQYGTGRNDA